MIIVSRSLARRTSALVLVVSMLGAACTAEPAAPASGSRAVVDDTGAEQPPPPVGSTVAIVLPPATELDPAQLVRLEAELELLADLIGPQVREVRALVPETPVFTADLAATFAARDVQTLCILGGNARSDLAELAERYPMVRFCALPGDEQVPDEASGPAEGPEDPTDDADEREVVELEIRVEQLGHLVGLVAGAAAGEAPVGLLLGEDELQAARFRAGLLAGLAGVEVLSPELEDASEPVDGVDALVRAGVGVVIVDGGAGAGEAVAALPDDVLVIGPDAVLEDVDPGLVAATWTVGWGTVLREMITDDAGFGRDSTRSFGVADDAFSVHLGMGAPPGTLPVLRDAEERLAAGDRDPLRPAPATLPPEVAPPEDEGDADADGDGGAGQG